MLAIQSFGLFAVYQIVLKRLLTLRFQTRLNRNAKPYKAKYNIKDDVDYIEEYKKGGVDRTRWQFKDNAKDLV